MSDAINQHKRMAMGHGMKKGGAVPPGPPTPVVSQEMPTKPPNLKTGMKASPLTVARAKNGIPGMNKGGKC